MREVGRRPNDVLVERAAIACAVLAAFLVLTFAAAPTGIRALGQDHTLRVDTPPTAAAAAAADASRAPSSSSISYQGTDLGPERIARPTPPPALEQDATVTDFPRSGGERTIPPPTLRPGDPGWVATRLEVPALGVNVAVAVASGAADEDFPPFTGAYIHRSSAQPGRGTNTYMFAHAMPDLFKPLWWARVGQQVIVTMSDGQELAYRVTAVVRDVPCPDPAAPKPAGLPPALANATECDISWTLPTASDRLSLQTSQGFNRNYGEMFVIAEADW